MLEIIFNIACLSGKIRNATFNRTNIIKGKNKKYVLNNFMWSAR